MPFLGKKPTEVASPVDINSGTIDGTTIGGGSASPATVTTFTSTGIDDNATSTAITIDSSQKATFSNSIEATVAYRAYDSVAAAYRNVLRYDSGNVRLETGSGGSEAITAFTGGAERMRIDASGNLLVGKDAPNGYVLGAEIKADGTGQFTVDNNPPLYANRKSSDGDIAVFAKDNSTYGSINAFSGALRIGATQELLFGSGGTSTERMRIDSSGNLLVGRSTKSFLTDGGLDLYTTTVATYGMSIDNAAGLANGVQSIVTLKYQNGLANMGCYKHSAVTNPSGYNYFTDSGNVRYFLYHNNGTWRTSTSSAHIGTTSGTVVGTQTSDERLKTIESGFEYGLESVMALSPIAYSFADEQERRLGFGAQTTQAIIPEVVYDTGECFDGYDTNPDDPMVQIARSNDTVLAMEYVQLIPVLTKAIQEQQAIIDSQASAIADLTTRLEALEAN